MSDMEDCSDELLSEFGRFRKDLALGLNFNLATTMITLLQRYALMSLVLDLTESLNIALFLRHNVRFSSSKWLVLERNSYSGKSFMLTLILKLYMYVFFGSNQL